MPDQTNQIAKLEALLAAAVDAIITIDANAIIQSINRATEILFGYKEAELKGRNVKCLMPDRWAKEHDGYVSNYGETGEKRIIGIGRDVQGMKKDGSVFHMHLSVSEYVVDGEVFYTGIIHDLTDRKQAELTLVRSQKMEAVGQLTGGIAHDFNNLLTVITGNLELLEMHLSDPGQIELLQEAQEAAKLGSDLTNRLLAFARRSILQPQSTDINEQVKTMSNILSRTIGGNVEFETALAQQLWNAKVDPGQFESVLLNLAVNARDAMPSGGKLIVETANASIDDDYLATEAGVAMGDYVRVSVSDTGEGMSQNTLERVFEPFFTTKSAGKGSGLGLPMVYGFAKQSGGHAAIYSEIGVGTTVNIYLPRDAVMSDGIRIHSGSKDGPILGKQQLILVVEDDPRVQKLSVQRLEALNYRCVTANNGSDALLAMEANPDIDLVFTDLVMPGGMSGYELTEHLGRHRPELPVLMTSGYAEDLLHADELSRHSIELLRKPYKIAELATMLEDLLN
jgi:PAS domain S-box-containing protein